MLLIGLSALGTSGCAGESTNRKVDAQAVSGISQDPNPPAIEPLTEDTEEVFDEFGYDPFEEPDSEKIEEYDPWEP